MTRRRRRAQAVPRRRLKRWVLAFIIGFTVGFGLARATSAAATPHTDTNAQSAFAADRAVATEIAKASQDGPTPSVIALGTATPSAPRGDGDPARAAPVSRGVQEIEHIITAAALEWGQDPEELIGVARCESSLRPDAVGDHGEAVGLFQFHPWRWEINAPALGYVGDLRADPVAAARVAAYAFATGQRSAWTCAR